MICFESTERANRNSSTLGDDEISELFAELPPQDCREGVPKDQQRGDCQGLGPKDLRGPYREHRLTDRGDSNQQRVQDSTYEVLQGEDFYLKGEVRWASKNKIIQATFLPHFVFARAPPCVACEVLHSRRGVRHFTDQCFWEPHLPAAYKHFAVAFSLVSVLVL